jgi:hypothetical protein
MKKSSTAVLFYPPVSQSPAPAAVSKKFSALPPGEVAGDGSP